MLFMSAIKADVGVCECLIHLQVKLGYSETHLNASSGMVYASRTHLSSKAYSTKEKKEKILLNKYIIL